MCKLLNLFCNCELRGLGHVQIVGSVFAKVSSDYSFI